MYYRLIFFFKWQRFRRIYLGKVTRAFTDQSNVFELHKKKYQDRVKNTPSIFQGEIKSMSSFQAIFMQSYSKSLIKLLQS